MVRDPLRLREGHGRVAERGDVLELVEVHSVDGRVTFDDGKVRLTTAGPGIGCVLTGMRPGEVRSFRVEEEGRTRESIRYEVRGFGGVPPRVRSRRVASEGEAAGAPTASGDVVKVLRVIAIDGKSVLTSESLEMTAYTEGFGALLLGMRAGDDVVFDVDGLDIKGTWLPAYDPNVRQHIEVELRVDQRVRTGADVARGQQAQQQDHRRKRATTSAMQQHAPRAWCRASAAAKAPTCAVRARASRVARSCRRLGRWSTNDSFA